MLTCPFAISYRGLEECLYLLFEGFLRPTRITYLKGRRVADPSHHPVSSNSIQLHSPCLQLQAVTAKEAQGSQGQSFCQGRCTGTWQIQPEVLPRAEGWHDPRGADAGLGDGVPSEIHLTHSCTASANTVPMDS